jgi:aminoglycoside 3-N-acetyltransferase
MNQHQYTPYREIASKLDFRKGDVVLLTSDILRLAMKARKTEKEFSADAFLDSFLRVLGDEGTLLIPAYNFDLEDGDHFDIKKSMPMTGSLAVAALKRADFTRTKHPLHSFCVSGHDASLLSAMNNISSFGPDSPFAYLMEKNAKMLFAGTTVAEAMTFTHFVEESEQVWYRRYKKMKIVYTDLNGETTACQYKLYAKNPGWTMHLERLQQLLSPEILKEYRFNEIPFSVISCRHAFELISADIRENNAASVAGFTYSLYFRDIIKQGLKRFKLFRTTHGKIRSAKRIHK